MLTRETAPSRRKTAAGRAWGAVDQRRSTITSGSEHERHRQPVQINRRLLHRKCAACAEADEHLDRDAAAPGGAGLAPVIVHDALNSQGRPLNADGRMLMESRFGHDFAAVRIHDDATAAASPVSRVPEGVIQRKCSGCEAAEGGAGKLPVSKPNDPLEREADRFAERVMQGRAPVVSPGAAPTVQRDALDDAVQQAEKVEDDESDTKPERVMQGTVAAKREGGPATIHAHSIPRGGGQPLAPKVLQFMQERTGFNFSNVRIHADAQAAGSAARLSARAYTLGSNIYFNRDQYQPENAQGQRLLAHELAHVVQQSPGQVQRTAHDGQDLANISTAPPTIQRDLLPPGNCIQGIHDKMQRAVKSWCDHPSGRTCEPGESCGRLLQKIRRNQLCAQNRRAINVKCYDGGDAGHRIAERDARRAQANCMAIFRADPKCTSPFVPVPQPEKKTDKPKDKDFLKKMEELTGLTGVALIIYLIVSEGSRLFPPRNLVPVP